MRTLVSFLALLLIVDAGTAHAGRRQILRAVASAIYAVSVSVDLAPATCTCIDAICDRAADMVLACGAAGVAGSSPASNTRIVVVQPAAAEDGRAECNVCACNDGQTDPLTLSAAGTCLAVPGR